jgi:hypothetical protein
MRQKTKKINLSRKIGGKRAVVYPDNIIIDYKGDDFEFTDFVLEKVVPGLERQNYAVKFHTGPLMPKIIRKTLKCYGAGND